MAKLINAIPSAGIGVAANLSKLLVPMRNPRSNRAEQIRKLGRILDCTSKGRLFERLMHFTDHPGEWVRGALPLSTSYSDPDIWERRDSYLKMMTIADCEAYLPDDILVKVDRAAMGVSLETRAPFLDHRVVELSFRIPDDFKRADGQGKVVLRELLFDLVPRELIERPKAGFNVPMSKWLQGELKDWGEAMLGESRLKAEGFFDVSRVRTAWHDHLSGKHQQPYLLWAILMFQAWLESVR